MSEENNSSAPHQGNTNLQFLSNLIEWAYAQDLEWLAQSCQSRLAEQKLAITEGTLMDKRRQLWSLYQQIENLEQADQYFISKYMDPVLENVFDDYESDDIKLVKYHLVEYLKKSKKPKSKSKCDELKVNLREVFQELENKVLPLCIHMPNIHIYNLSLCILCVYSTFVKLSLPLCSSSKISLYAIKRLGSSRKSM